MDMLLNLVANKNVLIMAQVIFWILVENKPPTQFKNFYGFF